MDTTNAEIQAPVITLSEAALKDFDLWINQSYLLHVDQIPPRGSRSFEAVDFYNANGMSLDKLPPEAIRRENQTVPGWPDRPAGRGPH